MRRIGLAMGGAAEWLHLAAAPSFASMALLTGMLDAAQPDLVCAAAAQHVSPLSGMVLAYGMFLFLLETVEKGGRAGGRWFCWLKEMVWGCFIESSGPPWRKTACGLVSTLSRI